MAIRIEHVSFETPKPHPQHQRLQSSFSGAEFHIALQTNPDVFVITHTEGDAPTVVPLCRAEYFRPAKDDGKGKGK